MRKIPALDGVRGLAAAAIVVDHGMGWDGFRIGVDVFFVLSGFLITSLLLGELGSTNRIDLARFWLRRLRRLVPPLIPVVAVGAAVNVWLLAPSGGVGGALASLFYVQNLRLAGLPHFVPDALTHTWSLSIEEHFYLVWPLVLLLVVRWRGPGTALGLAVCGIVAVTVERTALCVAGAPELRLYFADDTRADALLIGCVVALLVQLGRLPRVPGWIALVAAAGLGMVALDGSLAYRSVTNVEGPVALGAAVVIAYLAQSPCRPLEARGLGLLGRVSYALYLWHYPVSACLLYRFGWQPGPGMLLAVGGAGMLLAMGSDRYIEAPIRRRFGGRRPGPVLAEGATRATA